MAADQICEHIEKLDQLKRPKTYVCDECLQTGDDWVHLRTCQTCGATLCCDSSPNQHMTKHYHTSGHRVVISAEPGERWIFCYADDIIAEY